MTKTLLLVACLAILATTACLAAVQVVPAPGGPQASWWGKAPGERPTVSGTVTEVSATNIAVQTPQGVKSFTVAPKTRVVIAGKPATIADIKVGNQVTVRFRLMKNNVPVALHIAVPKPATKGKITAIEGSVITLKNKQDELKVTVTDATKFRSNGYEGTLADLRVGYSVAAEGAISGSTMTADMVRFVPIVAKGAVTAVDGNTITVKTVKQLSVVTLASDKTVVIVRPRVGPNKKGTLADVKVGAPVNIGFTATKDASSPLLWIEVLTGS